MSDRVNDLVMRVKQFVQDGKKQNDKTIIDIQNQIDAKYCEIRDIFADNIESVIQHYTKHQQTLYHQKKIEILCEQFGKKIEKTQKLSQYDENIIERSQKMLKSMSEVKMKLEFYREHIRLMKKATMSLNQNRYNNAIKMINRLKKQQLLIESPLNRVVPLIENCIRQHLKRLIKTFWLQKKSKQIEIGTLCFNKVLLSLREKMNIFQIFFGNSLRNSLISNNNSVIEDKNYDRPISFLKDIDEESDILQKHVFRMKLDMPQLKQVKFYCNQLSNSQLFEQMLQTEIFNVIKQIEEQNPCDCQNDFKKLISRIIGYLLMKRQVVAQFGLMGDSILLINQIYSILRVAIKSIIKNSNLPDINCLKEYLDIFYKVLELVKIQRNTLSFTILLNDLLENFCSLKLCTFQKLIKNEIELDNMTTYSTSSLEQKQFITLVLQIPINNSYHFTRVVAYVVDVLNTYYTQLLNFVRHTDMNKSQLHQYLSLLLQKIVEIYDKNILNKQNPLQLNQCQINLKQCHKAFQYYSSKLQYQYQYVRIAELPHLQKYQKLIVTIHTRIRQLVQQKIDIMMQNYRDLEQGINKKSSDFLEWMLAYICQIISCIRSGNNSFHQELIYTTIGHISWIYWQLLRYRKQFSLVTIYNLELDLEYIQKYCAKKLSIYPNLMDKFKSLEQLYSLLLKDNLQDILDPFKREATYSSLDITLVISILLKYNQIAKAINQRTQEERSLNCCEEIISTAQIQMIMIYFQIKKTLYRKNDIVIGKCKGFPAWPGYIMSRYNEQIYRVAFYASGAYAYIKQLDLEKLTLETIEAIMDKSNIQKNMTEQFKGKSKQDKYKIAIKTAYKRLKVIQKAQKRNRHKNKQRKDSKKIQIRSQSENHSQEQQYFTSSKNIEKDHQQVYASEQDIQDQVEQIVMQQSLKDHNKNIKQKKRQKMRIQQSEHENQYMNQKQSGNINWFQPDHQQFQKDNQQQKLAINSQVCRVEVTIFEKQLTKLIVDNQIIVGDKNQSQFPVPYSSVEKYLFSKKQGVYEKKLQPTIDSFNFWRQYYTKVLKRQKNYQKEIQSIDKINEQMVQVKKHEKQYSRLFGGLIIRLRGYLQGLSDWLLDTYFINGRQAIIQEHGEQYVSSEQYFQLMQLVSNYHEHSNYGMNLQAMHEIFDAELLDIPIIISHGILDHIINILICFTKIDFEVFSWQNDKLILHTIKMLLIRCKNYKNIIKNIGKDLLERDQKIQSKQLNEVYKKIKKIQKILHSQHPIYKHKL